MPQQTGMDAAILSPAVALRQGATASARAGLSDVTQQPSANADRTQRDILKGSANTQWQSTFCGITQCAPTVRSRFVHTSQISLQLGDVSCAFPAQQRHGVVRRDTVRHSSAKSPRAPVPIPCLAL
jgi:hypothetical protein